MSAQAGWVQGARGPVTGHLKRRMFSSNKVVNRMTFAAART